MLLIIAGAVKLFATISWGEMLRGLVAMTLTLLILSAAMEAMIMQFQEL